MKERLKLKGVVSARNSETGEVIFENLHNTIVLGGCITALAKIAGVGDSADVYIDDDIAEPTNWALALETPITDYNFTFTTGSNDPNVPPVDKELNSEDTDAEDHVFADTSILHPVEFFSGDETYDVADIPEGARDKHIVTLKEGCLSFIRYKLTLKNTSAEEGDIHVIDNKAEGGITYVNSIELFSTVGEGDERKSMLFSKLNFPAIPFFGSLSIDFEYRIYL